MKVIRQNTPLVTQPLKTSPATGATLACLGILRSIPLMHGSQGCSAFAKVYLIQHLREPIPLQNTAIDQISAVMGGEDNLAEALRVLCEKQAPELITVITTGLTEMQGCDVYHVISNFRRSYPQFAATRIVSVSTPDFTGSMQTGYAETVRSLVKQLVQHKSDRPGQRTQVNVLCSIGLTGADIETLKRYFAAFALEPVFVPDLSLSLDGHLGDAQYSATSTGGTSVLELEMMADSAATLVFGDALVDVAQWLERRFGVPYHEMGMAMTLGSTDALILQLSRLSGLEVPYWLTRARQRLQDAMLDTHFLLSSESCSIALEPDLAVGYAEMLASVGGHVAQLITTVDAPGLAQLTGVDEVIIGDLSCINGDNPHLKAVISNTHAAHICEPDLPVLRAGYPCHDQFGNMDIRQIGYEGVRERLFALANLCLHHHQDEVAPHLSAYRFEAHEVRQNQEG
ncbi:nitrogenase iron-molybdenum cofactor biosynthesis protein NifN [Vibrio mangrovi]|uniref:Nitrogenase iron-molybdenum cofactor biosynthesis protein NifN n=1 Tax=Vibrio mangrovi TaxID=474394 RepID=A0A1Y6INF8_9VIBR|nr:nitrogenase iron-molybdenum cofactor biosynthesis protein NifN [Vibrio mangrovi]MDW6004009.1 nitrogenase iron-molybdenum cofactor biosynthesis protein NifN [Vibrio mangrovi]SMR99194.1 Nitrogenase molybdenum-iron protein beta chain [Vibrio mangrovi]